MAPARYAPLPNAPPSAEADRELDAAFESDHEEDLDSHLTESTPFIYSQAHVERTQPPLSVAIQGAYDFERDYEYDRPPPGSPPGPSSAARPNDYGNSNGLVPESPVIPNVAGQSFFRRALGSLLPQRYSRLASEPSRAVGGGVENDGVFANVTAKPGRAVQVRGEDGNVHMVPEESQKEMPPSYSEAQADAVPQYWETTVHAPSSLDPNADMIVDDLPTGSFLLFISNMFISYFFNFVGFLLTYLLHTSHAAKYGSRAGLGLSLIQYGFYSKNKEVVDEYAESQGYLFWNSTTGMLESVPQAQPTPELSSLNGTSTGVPPNSSFDLSSQDWLAFLFMTLGWFLLLSSVVGFYRVKRWEMSIRASANVPPPTAEDRRRDAEMHRNVQRAFFMPMVEDDEQAENQTPNNVSEAEARLQRDLRAAGFL